MGRLRCCSCAAIHSVLVRPSFIHTFHQRTVSTSAQTLLPSIHSRYIIGNRSHSCETEVLQHHGCTRSHGRPKSLTTEHPAKFPVTALIEVLTCPTMCFRFVCRLCDCVLHPNSDFLNSWNLRSMTNACCYVQPHKHFYVDV